VSFGGKVARADFVRHFLEVVVGVHPDKRGLYLISFARQVLIDRFTAPVGPKIEHKVNFEEVISIRICILIQYLS